MQRMKAARRAKADDPHRPIYHYVNPEFRLNDPNGLCYWQGLWHLFYQALPPEDHREHWGHAVSYDLIHWRDLPYALGPGPEEKCYSGTALVEESNGDREARVVVMYHAPNVGNMVAISHDPLLLNWEKIEGGRPVIPLAPADGPPLPYEVYDPCVAVRVYPGRPDSTGVSLLSRGQASELLSLDCWQMKNIYEES